MGDLGKVRPSFNEGEQCVKWEVPIAVYKNGHELKVTAIYEDGGFLCIDLEDDKVAT